MSRTWAITIAALSILAAAGNGFAQILVINQPKLNSREFANGTAGITASDSTIVNINIPGGLDASAIIRNGEVIRIRAAVLDSTGALVGFATPNPLITGTTYTDVALDLDVDMSSFDFNGLFGAGNVIQLTAFSLTGSGLAAVFNATDETLDETIEFNTATPVFQTALISSTKAFFRFSESVDSDNDAVGPPNENVNDTDLGSLAGQFDAGDIQVNSSATFTGTEPTATLLTNPVFSGATRNIIEFDLGVGSNVVAGDFVRLSHDGAPGNATHDLFSIVGLQGDATAVQITALPALDATTAVVIRDVKPSTTELAVLRVTFNDEITNPGDAGDYTLLLSGVPSTFTVTNPTIDPTDNRVVLLDVTAPAGDSIEDDARTNSSDGDATGVFTLRVLADGMGADITDVFNQTISTPDDVTVADRIPPTLAATGFGDTNPTDGRQDTFYIVFDEPMTAPSATTGFTLTERNNITVNPFDLIDALGNLVSTLTATDSGTPANNIIPIAGAVVASVDLDADGTIVARETNNAICLRYDALAFDWNHNGQVGPVADPNEPIPGTGDADVLTGDYNVTADEIDDASGNAFGSSIAAALSTVDYARPRIARAALIDGDNTDPDQTAVINDNDQELAEQFVGGTPAASDVGRALESRRVELSFSENLAALTNAILEERVLVAGVALQAATNDMGSFGFAAANKLTLRNNGASTTFDSGAAVQINAMSAIVDASTQANEALDSATMADGRAPYLLLQAAIDSTNPPTHGARLIDTDADTFANEIRLQMTQPIDAATLATTDFTPTFGTITGIAVDATSNRVIVITLNDGDVSATSPMNVTYNGVADTTPIASNAGAGGTGLAVSRVDSTFAASPLPDVQPTDDVAVMDIIGTATQGGTPVPAGTRVIAMVATPVIKSISAIHNGVTFTATDTASRTAFTNWLLGLAGARFVYLGRDATNKQVYANNKDLADPTNEQTLMDVIELKISAFFITQITFFGFGETFQDTLFAGSVEICWDVLRSADGSTQSLYTSGYAVGGTPIISQTVIQGTNGRYELHVGAPISAFNRRANLESFNRPIILICELPDGTRFPLSSLLTSVNGAPVMFSATNRAQNFDGTAFDATVFDFDLDRSGPVSAHPGWNLLGFDRNSGFSFFTSTRPVLPTGLNAADIVVGTALPFAGALDQFVYVLDTDGDGRWTSTEDSDLSDIIIDSDCFDNFAFTMTSFGVQAGTGITNLVGGYGLGLFVDGGSTYGVFQFGARRTGTDFFLATFPFPNTATTLGWGLFTAPSAFATPGAINTANPEFDFMIQFRNDGIKADVATADLGNPTGTNNVNDVADTKDGEASFYHIRR